MYAVFSIPVILPNLITPVLCGEQYTYIVKLFNVQVCSHVELRSAGFSLLIVPSVIWIWDKIISKHKYLIHALGLRMRVKCIVQRRCQLLR